MLNTTQCFLKLLSEHNHTQIESLKNFAKTCEYKWVPNFYVYDSQTNPLPQKLQIQFYDDPFIKQVKKFFGGDIRFYKVPARSVYRWHKDWAHNCCFNLVFEEYHSHTLFSINSSHNDVDQIEELKYELNQWYLFNTQVKHMVVNLDDHDRHLVTYRISDKKVTYEQVKEWYLQFSQNKEV